MKQEAEVELYLFNYEFTSKKKPAANGKFSKTIVKKHMTIISRNRIDVIKRFKKRHEITQAIVFSRLASLNFLDSGFFGGRYGY